MEESYQNANAYTYIPILENDGICQDKGFNSIVVGPCERNSLAPYSIAGLYHLHQFI